MRLIAIFVLFVLLISSVYAIEITPTKKIFEFNSGAKESGQFTIMNSEGKDLRLVVSTRGEASQYITLKDFIVDMGADEGSKTFTYEINFPAQFDKPGTHEAEIVVMAQPISEKGVGTYVGTSIALATGVKIRVPYPGKYAEGRLVITEANVNEVINFVIPVSNLGSQDIGIAGGIISILGPTNTEISSIKTLEKPIKSQTTQELSAEWNANVEPGIYAAKATVSYDDQTMVLNKNFAVGNVLVEIIDAQVKDFKLGGIAKITLTLQNKWNSEVKDLYAELFVYDSQGTLLYVSKSSSIAIAAQGTEALPVYWDTQGMLSGTYSAKIVLNYADRKTEKPLELIVRPDSMEARLTGRVSSSEASLEKPTSFSFMSIILIAVVILISLNIALFVYLRRTVGNIKK